MKLTILCLFFPEIRLEKPPAPAAPNPLHHSVKPGGNGSSNNPNSLPSSPYLPHKPSPLVTGTGTPRQKSPIPPDSPLLTRCGT